MIKDTAKLRLRVLIFLLLFVLSEGIFGWMRLLADTVTMALDYIILPDGLDVSAEDVASRMEKSAVRGGVWVVATDDDIARAREKIANNERFARWHEVIADSGEELLYGTPLLAYSLDKDGKLLEVSRAAVSRMIILGYLWQMTGDDRYAARAEKEILNVCAFPDWHSEHFLDAAEMAFAVALGCNWMGDAFDGATKDTAADACRRYALEEGKGKPFKNWWRWAKNNWNNVCHGALAVASMVFYDYYPELAADFIADAYSRFSYTFDNMGPDGVYAEGSGYWDYNIDYLWYFISTGENVMGTDFGLKTAGSGCLSAGDFPLYITGAQGAFNYGDNKSDNISSAALYWFSRQNGRGVLSKFQNIAMDRAAAAGHGSPQLALSALFATDEYDDAEWDMPLSAHLRSAAGEDLAVMRDGYFDPNGTYAAIKGGYNYTNHGDLDIGTFVFDSMGERWAEDLGPSDYGTPGYFVGIVGGGRWKTYAKRAEGQNTLVFNPNALYEDQYPYARASFSGFSSSEDGAICTLDMSDAYCYAGVENTYRTFELFDEKTSLRITDTFKCAVPSRVYWFMHTKADIEIVDKHTAVLSINGKRMLAKLSADSVGEFSVMQLESLVAGVDNRVRFGDGVRKLAVSARGVKSGKICVELVPLYDTISVQNRL